MLLLPLLEKVVEVAHLTWVLLQQLLQGPGLVCWWCWCP